MKLATTLKTAIWAARNVDTQIKEKDLEKAKPGEKMKFEGSSRSIKRSRFSKSVSINKRSRDTNEDKWCEKCMKKHFGRCTIEVTSFNNVKTSHYATNCSQSVCYQCGEVGHLRNDYVKKNEAARPNVMPKPKERAFQMILDEVDDTVED